MMHRRQAGPVAQMRDNQAPLGRSAEGRHDVFVGQPVKSIPSYAFMPQVTGEWEALRQLRHAPVEGGVKACHLRQTWKARRHCLDALDRTR